MLHQLNIFSFTTDFELNKQACSFTRAGAAALLVYTRSGLEFRAGAASRNLAGYFADNEPKPQN